MKLSQNIQKEMAVLAGGDDKARLAARIMQVQNRYRETIEKVYRDNAQIFLDHTNSVYIIDKNGAKTLIVYMDESIYAAELNAQRELIRLHMLQMFGEQIDSFDIHVSRGSYKKKYLYKDKKTEDEGIGIDTDEVIDLLSPEKEEYVDRTIEGIADDRLREAIKKAMTADLKRRKQ